MVRPQMKRARAETKATAAPGKLVQLSIRIPEDLHKRLGHYTIDHDVTAKDIVVKLLDEFLSKHGQ
jgi:hypothetical protein